MSIPAMSALGAIEVVIGDRTLGPRDLGGPKPKQILEILLVHDGQPVPKDRIADQLWGEALPQDWRRTLEAYISTIRANLGAEGRNLIVTEPNAYRLALERVALDVHRFGDLIDVAGTQTGGERAATLDEAIGLARGDLLSDEPYATWAIPMRTLYRERLLSVLLDAAEAHIEAGSAKQALAYAERAIDEQPTRERAYRLAMRAHSVQGERGLAMLDYDRCRKVLREQLGIDPSPDTERTYLQILNEEPAADTISTRSTGSPSPGPTMYARSGPVSIAYKIVGEGQPDLVLVRGFVSHVEACWEWPPQATFLYRLAGKARLIIFDKRGTGMSDPVLEPATLEERADDLRAVLDAVGSERAVVMGMSEGGPLCIRFAADHPDRVAGLVLYGAFARALSSPDYAFGIQTEESIAADLERIEIVWATGTAGPNPSMVEDEAFREFTSRYYRLSASPSMARALIRMNATIDVRDLLPKITAPTLIVHRRDEIGIPVQTSRYMAELIPGAHLVEVPGADHWPWVGDMEAVLNPIERFLEEIVSA